MKCKKERTKWAAAVAERRVVRIGNGMRFTAYPTPEAASAACTLFVAAGIPANIAESAPW